MRSCSLLTVERYRRLSTAGSDGILFAKDHDPALKTSDDRLQTRLSSICARVCDSDFAPLRLCVLIRLGQNETSEPFSFSSHWTALGQAQPQDP